MKVRVVGSSMEVGQSLTQFVEEHLTKSVKKFFENALDAEVHFSKQGLLFRANIVIDEGVRGRNLLVRSNAEAGDVYGAFNEALDKAVRQLRKHKERIKHYRHGKAGIKGAQPDYKLLNATKYILPPVEYNVFEEMEEGEFVEDAAKVISEKVTNVEELTVNEAIMKMDLANLPAIVFINKDNKRINVVYHRRDGNISWIDPQQS